MQIAYLQPLPFPLPFLAIVLFWCYFLQPMQGFFNLGDGQGNLSGRFQLLQRIVELGSLEERFKTHIIGLLDE